MINNVSLKNKLKKEKLTLGSWITIGHPIIAEIMARQGFEWLTIDMEHSAITLDITQQLIQVIEGCGVIPLVRVGENNYSLIKRVMDAGAHGVIVPMINSKQDAETAVNAVKYPPNGMRGVGLARAQGYGFNFEEYKKKIDKELIVIAQIEHIDAIRNLESILSVRGIDGTIIGPYDLSASMGYPGEFEREEMIDTLDRYGKISKKHNKSMGIHIIPPKAEEVHRKIDEGFTFIAVSLDTLFLGEKIRDVLRSIKR